MNTKNQYQFLLKNFLKGLLWLVILLLAFIYLKDSLNFKSNSTLMQYGNSPILIFTIYTLSELILGIIPPELFMMWSLEFKEVRSYTIDLGILAGVSYLAGTASYLFGRYFNQTVLYRIIRRKFLRGQEEKFNQYGGLLLVVAAITPIPYSATCIFIGSIKYPLKRFLLLSIFRILRFIIYGYFVWKASLI